MLQKFNLIKCVSTYYSCPILTCNCFNGMSTMVLVRRFNFLYKMYKNRKSAKIKNRKISCEIYTISYEYYIELLLSVVEYYWYLY